MNYQYRNLFRLGDYPRSAALYRRIAPGLMVSGHWGPRWVDHGYLDYLAEEGRTVDDIHEQLLPLDHIGIGPDGQTARISPYRARAVVGEQIPYVVSVRNPLREAADARIELVLPPGWRARETTFTAELDSEQEAFWEVALVPAAPGRRCRIAIDVTIGALMLGQHAEALVDVEAAQG
jgi:hypothetical protein